MPSHHLHGGEENSFVYGVHAVAEALRSPTVEHLRVAEGCRNRRVQELVDACRTARVPVRFCPRKDLDRMAGTTGHQDVVAVCAPRTYAALDSLVEGKSDPLLIVLDGVEDPRNLGAVGRTAAATGADGLIIPERRSAGLSPVAAKASAGALEHLPVARVKNLVRALEWLKERNVWITGFDTAADRSYLEADFRGPCALVLGGEGRGLRPLVRRTCDHMVSIPLYGPVSSLNVSVAAAVALYEVVRQRRGKNEGRNKVSPFPGNLGRKDAS